MTSTPRLCLFLALLLTGCSFSCDSGPPEDSSPSAAVREDVVKGMNETAGGVSVYARWAYRRRMEEPPPLDSLKAFPSEERAVQAWKEAERFLDQTYRRPRTSPEDDRYREALRVPAYYSMTAWQRLAEAHRYGGENNPQEARRYLNELRRDIGEKRFNSGQMPSPVPLPFFMRQ